jgi:hypothetical protein
VYHANPNESGACCYRGVRQRLFHVRCISVPSLASWPCRCTANRPARRVTHWYAPRRHKGGRSNTVHHVASLNFPLLAPFVPAGESFFCMQSRSHTCKDSFPLSPLSTRRLPPAPAHKPAVEAIDRSRDVHLAKSLGPTTSDCFVYVSARLTSRRSELGAHLSPTHLIDITPPWRPHRLSRTPQQKQPPRLSPTPWPPRRSPLPSPRRLHPSHPHRRRSPRMGTVSRRTWKTGRSGRTRRRTMGGSRRCLTMRRGLT